MAEYQSILTADEGPVARITLNRPEKRNALSLEMMRELIDCLADIGRRRQAAVVVLDASGPVFSAGHDLRELVDRDASAYREIFEVCTKLMETIQTVPQPVIAQVHGVATAAGCQLAATCDLVVASDDARFATPGVRIGLFCSTPMVALSRVVGRKKAMEMLLTGDFLSAPDAVAAGLANRVVPRERLAEETRALAEHIAAASPFVIDLGKQAFYKQLDMPQPLAYSYTKEVMSLNAMTPQAHEGICAFLERRQPHWPERS
jgi:enoyl-CoA hydratase/carnithine racemase